MKTQWIDLQPVTLRRLALAFAALAAIAGGTVAMAYIGEPPEWNRIDRAADAFELGFIAALLADLAREREVAS